MTIHSLAFFYDSERSHLIRFRAACLELDAVRVVAPVAKLVILVEALHGRGSVLRLVADRLPQAATGDGLRNPLADGNFVVVGNVTGIFGLDGGHGRVWLRRRRKPARC